MDTEWSTEDLWRQEQSNFSAHLAMMFRWVEERGGSLEEFIDYVGRASAASWEGTESAEELMEGVLLNVRSNGHEVLSVEREDGRVRARVTGLVRADVMEFFGVPAEQSDRFWDKFVPLAEALGLRFSWRRAGDGVYEVEVAEG
jgi:hypothetical protein